MIRIINTQIWMAYLKLIILGSWLTGANAACLNQPIDTQPSSGTGGCRISTYVPATNSFVLKGNNLPCSGTDADEILVCVNPSGCVANAGRGNDKISIDTNVVTGSAINYLCGSDGNDQIIGGASTDYIDGGSGDDTLNGGSGNDYIFGNVGDDTIEGGYGRDTLDGQIGDDTLYGEGRTLQPTTAVYDDILIGGPGDDTMDGGQGLRDTCSQGSSINAIGDTRLNCELFGN